MPNPGPALEVERLARLMWPRHEATIEAVGSNVGFHSRSPILKDGVKGVTYYADGARHLLATGSSFRAIAADMRRVLTARGIDHSLIRKP